MKHTPTPAYKLDGSHIVYGDNPHRVAIAFASAETAEEFIRARNAHDDLLSCLKQCEELLLRYEINRIDCDEIADASLVNIRAAIAKAEGK